MYAVILNGSRGLDLVIQEVRPLLSTLVITTHIWLAIIL